VTFGTPGGPLLKDGEEIKTKPTVDMSEVISQLGTLGSKLEQVIGEIGKSMGSGGEGGSIFQRIDKLVTDNGPKLTESISNLQDITAKIKNGEGSMGKLINDPKLHDELLAGVSEIKLAAADARSFMSDTKGIVADVKSGKGTLGVLLYDDATATSIKVTAKNLRELSDKINGGQGTLGKLLADDTMYRDLQGVMKKADRALDGLGDQGPITAVGVVAGALF
jgi:phospholipid/cholesterol/gamma-HCH transport system substrate-binding protein